MQLQNTFDLDDFLAYLLPGALLFGILALYNLELISSHYLRLDIRLDLLAATAAFGAIFSICLILGHIFSMASRFIWRPLLNNLLGGDPEKVVFLPANQAVRGHIGSYFNTQLNRLIQEKAARVFKLQAAEQQVLMAAMPRLIRSWVFTQSERANTSREQLVRSRSLCANFVTPLIVLAVWAWFWGPLAPQIWVSGTLIAAAILLLIKQRDLDVREAKEIYLFFLALPDDADAVKGVGPIVDNVAPRVI